MLPRKILKRHSYPGEEPRLSHFSECLHELLVHAGTLVHTQSYRQFLKYDRLCVHIYNHSTVNKVHSVQLLTSTGIKKC